MSRTFLQLQTELETLHKDVSAAWIAGGASNKLAVNLAYEHVYDIVKHSGRVAPYIAGAKTTIALTNKAYTLPANFDCVNVLSTCDYTTESDIDNNDARYDFYDVRGVSGSRVLTIRDSFTTLYLSYIPIVTDLVLDADIPVIPPEIHRAIAKFALYEYFIDQREVIAAKNAMDSATAYLNEKLQKLW
jgi:hypothetical protein